MLRRVLVDAFSLMHCERSLVVDKAALAYTRPHKLTKEAIETQTTKVRSVQFLVDHVGPCFPKARPYVSTFVVMFPTVAGT